MSYTLSIHAVSMEWLCESQCIRTYAPNTIAVLGQSHTSSLPACLPVVLPASKLNDCQPRRAATGSSYHAGDVTVLSALNRSAGQPHAGAS